MDLVPGHENCILSTDESISFKTGMTLFLHVFVYKFGAMYSCSSCPFWIYDMGFCMLIVLWISHCNKLGFQNRIVMSTMFYIDPN